MGKYSTEKTYRVGDEEGHPTGPSQHDVLTAVWQAIEQKLYRFGNDDINAGLGYEAGFGEDFLDVADAALQAIQAIGPLCLWQCQYNWKV